VLAGAAYQDAFFAWPRPAQERYVELVRAATTTDPEWTASFLRWLRAETPMRYPALSGPRRGLFRSLGDPSFRVIPWVGGVGEIRRIRGLISYLATN
jgi:hypothetical protein